MDKSNNPMGVKRSLPLKIAGISCALLAAAILVLPILNLHSILGVQAAIIRYSTIVSAAIPAVLILILAVLITAAVCRIVLLRPIRAVIDMLKSLRDGDLTQKLTIQSGGEIGEMASHINFTVEKVKSMVSSLEQRGRLLDTANMAAAILLTNNDMDAFETSLIKCFELIGERMDADRVQIWRNEIIENEPHFVLRYQWLSDYEKNCNPIPLGLHFPYSMKEEWHRKFSNREYINAPVSELPEEDRSFLMPYGLKSLVIIPMFLEGNFWGFFSIDDCRRERAFSKEEINILTSTGLMMSSAVNRNIQTLIAREVEERTQIMFNSAPFGMTFWDEGLNIIDCNNEVVRLFDLSDKQEFIDRFYEFSPEYQPDGSLSKEKATEIIKRAMDEGYYRYEWTHKKKNGELILMEVIFVRVRYRGKYSLIAHMSDLREQKAIIAANEKMRKTDEFAQVMFKAMPLTCHLWNTELQCIMCNDEAVRVYRVKDRKYFLENFFEFSPEYQPDGRLSKEKGYEYLKRGFEEGYMRFEWIHKRGDGEEFPCEITIIRTMYGGEPALLTYTRDLSEEIAVIKERQKAEIAEEGSKAKSDFLAKMSHEIRTPMNAILGITEIQLQDDSHPPLTKEAFERIYNSGNLLLGIINDILDLSKIEAGKLELTAGQYDIASLIHDTVQINIMRYETKPIKFILNVKEDLPLLLIGDELRIKQILNNLLSNAFKYTDKGSVKLTAYAEPADIQNTSKINLVFIISDTGQGMTGEQVQKLGTEYSRFNLQANRKTEGTGLGMNITRNLIQLMNGAFSIESTLGKGSSFTVRLPQDSAGSALIGKEIADNLMGLNFDNSVKLRAFQIKKDYMPYGRVLVVDDVETNLYVARGLMAPYGLSLETAMSGFEAIEKIKAGFTYDIIFMDHMMPGMDGIEAVKIIRDLGYSKPIVALTANAISGQAAMFMENGFDDFISKPIDLRQLNITLNKLIRDKYPSDVVEAAKKQKNRLYSGGVQKKTLEPQLAEAFIRDAKKAITELEEVYLEKCRSEEDFSTFIIDVHAMKSALANIGETDISADALKLEMAGREKNTDLILSELPSFMETLRGVIKKFESGENDEKKVDDPGDNKSLKEKLLIVKKACASYDKKTAKDTLVEIKRKTWPRHVNEQLLSLNAHLLHSDFDEAALAIDGYIKQL